MRSEPVPGLDVYTYPVRDGKVVHVVWSYDSETHQYTPPAKAQVLDIFGNPKKAAAAIAVEWEPVYVIVPAP